MRILIIEDEPSMVEQLKHYLLPIASLIENTDELNDAVNRAGTGKFNLIILDLKLVKTGKEEALAAIPLFKKYNSAVVVVSGLPEPNLKAEVEAAGADAFVPKNGSFSDRALLLATQVATMKLPKTTYRSETYQSHVDLLTQLATA